MTASGLFSFTQVNLVIISNLNQHVMQGQTLPWAQNVSK